jgi:predicted anti-sigma-YlaC factor YlaD
MVSCDVICDLMVVYASGEASSETERLVEEHLARCPTCRQALGEEEAVGEALGALESAQTPSDGQQFIARTRRLIFALSVGALTLFGCLLVAVQRVLMEGIAGISLPHLPGRSAPWLAVAATMLALYLALLLWRRGQTAATALGGFSLSLLAAAPLLVLILLVYQLAGTGGVPTVVLAGSSLLIALGATFALLPRLPHVTLTTVLVLLLVSGLLLLEAAVGVAALGDFSWQTPAELSHPPEDVALEEAVQVDLTVLGLSRRESMEPSWVDNVWIGSQAKAVRAAYEGEDSRARITLIRFEDQQRADEFFTCWKEAFAEGIQMAHFEINLPGLPGQGRIWRSYEPHVGVAYSAWRTDRWVTIIEVPGPVHQAVPLAREVKELTSRSFRR